MYQGVGSSLTSLLYKEHQKSSSSQQTILGTIRSILNIHFFTHKMIPLSLSKWYKVHDLDSFYE